MAHPSESGLLVIERLLRDRDGVWQQIIEQRELGSLTRQMLVSCAVSLGLYGAVLGASNSWAQALSSMVKLPLLFLATLAICLPTLYLFNLVFGAKLSMMQAVALILVAVTVTAVLTLAFAPISLFFLISAHSYSFYKLLNVAILMLTAVVGLRFLTAGMRTLEDHQRRLAMPPARSLPEPAAPVDERVEATPASSNGGQTGGVAVHTAPPVTAPPVTALPVTAPPLARPDQRARPQQSSSMSLLYIWILLFGFVGTQLAWTLRPFFGDPGRPFALFRHIQGTFYSDILQTIGRLLTHG